MRQSQILAVIKIPMKDKIPDMLSISKELFENIVQSIQSQHLCLTDKRIRYDFLPPGYSCQANFAIPNGKEKFFSLYAATEIAQCAKSYVPNFASVIIAVPNSLWKEMNHDSFISLITKASIQLQAIFAYIDIDDVLAPRDPSNTPFWFFAEDKYNVQKDLFIPSVNWWQIWDTRLIHEQGPIETILRSLDAETDLIHYGDRNYVTVRLNQPLLKMKPKYRLPVRQAFVHSFPPLSFDKLAKFPNSIDYSYHRENIPLFEDEKIKLQEIINANTQNN